MSGELYIGKELVAKVSEVTLTFSDATGFNIGDRLAVSGVPNCERHIVSGVFEHKLDLKRIIRPSRGYARHIRRRKVSK